LNKDGSGYSLVRSFGGTPPDGQFPSGLVEGQDGLLYGTTYGGGSNGLGTAFVLAKDACVYTVLYSFDASPGDSQSPSGALVRGSNGVFYGVTGAGGDVGFGTVYRLGIVPQLVVSIISQPQSQTVRTGSNVTFCVLASSSLPITYQWRFNGTNLSGATNSELLLTNVQFLQSGAYDVIVADTNSLLSDPAVLTVLAKPVITSQPAPTNQTVLAGTPFSITLSAVGTLPLSYGWRLNGKLFTNIVLNSNTCVFTVPGAQTNHAGTYRVGITNIVGNAVGLSAAAVVVVLPDTDHDGMPDDWEHFYGFNPNDPSDAAQDADGDGMTNWQEYVAGTDPRDPQSFLKLLATEPGGTPVLQFLAVSNRTYAIEARAALDNSPWTRVAGVAASSTNRTVNVTDPTVPPGLTQRFYRLVIPPSAP
jgi:uncharacterized repeat protein (TIGR03803 family)